MESNSCQSGHLLQIDRLAVGSIGWGNISLSGAGASVLELKFGAYQNNAVFNVLFISTDK